MRIGQMKHATVLISHYVFLSGSLGKTKWTFFPIVEPSYLQMKSRVQALMDHNFFGTKEEPTQLWSLFWLSCTGHLATPDAAYLSSSDLSVSWQMNWIKLYFWNCIVFDVDWWHNSVCKLCCLHSFLGQVTLLSRRQGYFSVNGIRQKHDSEVNLLFSRCTMGYYDKQWSTLYRQRCHRKPWQGHYL